MLDTYAGSTCTQALSTHTQALHTHTQALRTHTGSTHTGSLSHTHRLHTHTDSTHTHRLYTDTHNNNICIMPFTLGGCPKALDSVQHFRSRARMGDMVSQSLSVSLSHTHTQAHSLLPPSRVPAGQAQSLLVLIPFYFIDYTAAEKSRSHHQARSSMRRTSSLDTIIGPYLIGQWPREADGHDTTWFNEKATQTPSIWHEVRTERKNSHKRSASWGSADQLKEIAKLRHQLQRTKLSKRYGKDKGRQSPLHGDYTAMGTIQQGHPSKFIPILSANLGITKLIPRLRNSLEAINQEIEGMFIKEHGDKEVLRVGNPAEFTSLLLLRSYCMAAECVGFSRNVELKLVQCIVLGYCTLPQSLHLAPFSPFSSPVCKPSSSTPYLPPPLPWARAGSASVERSETLCEGSYISASCCCYCG
uniref:Uncharacterized protein n=1 Tax=Callorhinchus milii TaxID=7868 RepID=A0A4W3HXU6_CALMI